MSFFICCRCLVGTLLPCFAPFVCRAVRERSCLGMRGRVRGSGAAPHPGLPPPRTALGARIALGSRPAIPVHSGERDSRCGDI